MNWENFVEIQKVPAMYSDLNLLALNENLKNIGRKWLKEKNPLIFYGSVGTGKTYFAYCLAKALLTKTNMDKIIFTKSKAMDDKLMNEYSQYGNSNNAIEMFSEIDFLFIDDFGIERASDKMERDLMEILDNRWANFKTTVITTNLDAENIEKFYGLKISSRLKEFEWIYFGTKDLRGTNKNSEKFKMNKNNHR
jgi:DNA replication protein DnaC